MTRLLRGFTVVELLIIITSLGILIGIVTVGWSAVNTMSRDKAREQDTKQWATTFDLYKSRYVVYPALPSADGTAPPQAAMLCLGTFTGGKCVQVNGPPSQNISDTDSSSLLTEVKKLGNQPTNNGPSVNGQYAGPFVYIWQSTSAGIITVNAKFVNFFDRACPSGFTRETTQPSPGAPFTSLLSGVPSSVYVCSFTKSMTYDPS